MPFKPLYLIALLPPDDMAQEVQNIKKEIAEKYGSHEAVRRPAHVTLHKPFSFPGESEEALSSALRQFAATEPPFQLAFHGFDTFARPRVIFINPVKNAAKANHFFAKTPGVCATFA